MKFPFFLTPARYYKGLAWYSKEVTVPADWKGSRIVLFLERPHIESTVWVDGKKAGSENSLNTPHEFDITAFVKNNAENVIELEILGHRRNSHGPLHMDETWPHWTGPEQFWQNSKRAYNLVPCGLLGEPQVIIADSF